MNKVGNGFFRAFIGIHLVASFAIACPPACAPYENYYVIVTSGFDEDAVLEKGKGAATRLGAELVTGSVYSAYEKFTKCVKPRDRCMAFISSDEDLIGKSSWTPDEVARGELHRKTFAVAFYFDSYETKKNLSQAKEVLKAVQKFVPDAYLKPMSQCACE